MARKRVYDIAVLGLIFLTMAPVLLVFFAVVCAAVWLTDRGPVFYQQHRLGVNGIPFMIIKFRTMTVSAETHTGPIWATQGDQRITAVGRILRPTHVDEMPQIWNVLKGEMSLVGPRPERPELAELFTKRHPGFTDRLAVKPGIAALSHVYGDYWTSPLNRLRYDRLYIANMGIWLDTKIICLSVWKSLGFRIYRNGRARRI